MACRGTLPARRIHRDKLGRVEAAVFVADVVAAIGEREFADAPHQRLDVRRRLAAPDGQHSAVSPVVVGDADNAPLSAARQPA